MDYQQRKSGGYQMKQVSIIIPCYNEESNLTALYQDLTSFINEHKEYLWQILLIDDGSRDKTFGMLQQIRQKDERFCYIRLSRNFGKENAMLAGFDYVKGECCVIMDADLQHPINVIPKMIALWEQGYDDVYAKRKNRGKESYLRKSLSLTYYKLLQKIADVDILPNVGDFRLLDRKCINALKELRETQRYTKGLYCWIGFNKKEIEFYQGDRTQGISSFNYHKLFNLAIEGITSYTIAPLRISTLFGIIASCSAFLYMIYIFIKTIILGDPVQGFPTLIIIILFLGGVQLLSLGIIGEYLGRIFMETKHRPIYIINEKEGI